jgi:hypothetical protein
MAHPTIQSLLKSMDWKSQTSVGAWSVLNALEKCRTASLGWHLMQCDRQSCAQKSMIYHSCRNRHCPQCGSKRQQQWMEDRMQELLPCNYFHMVFTLPHELNALCMANRKFFYDLMFRVSSNTVKAFCGKEDKKTPGIISVLHTWGQQLSFHPHIHMLVTGGGTDRADGFYSLAKANGYYLFPIKAIRRMYRSMFLQELYHALKENQLLIPESLHKMIYYLLSELKQKEWLVYAKRPFAGPEQVVAYLGRYTHRVAISNQRLKKIDEQQVTFWYKDYADNSRKKLITLSKAEFLRRFAQHILPRGFMKIRSYGIFGNYRRKTRLAKIREQNCFATPKVEPTSLVRWVYQQLKIPMGVCPCCKTGKLVMVDIVYKGKHEDAISWMRSDKMMQ